jgi:hypothetical protein
MPVISFADPSDPDPHWECGSISRSNKINKNKNENFSLTVFWFCNFHCFCSTVPKATLSVLWNRQITCKSTHFVMLDLDPKHHLKQTSRISYFNNCCSFLAGSVF